MIIGHGGNKQALAERIGCLPEEITDMSSNLNPLGPPDMVKDFLPEHLDKIKSLPQPDAAGMVQGFADFHGIDPGRVMAGNGTTWFIYTIPPAMHLKKALVIGPTYSDYRDACAMNGTHVIFSHARRENGFLPDMNDVLTKAKDCDAVFVCNPDNPTGIRIPKAMLAELIKKNSHALIILDESYLPFVDQAESFSMVARTEYKNLAVLSSMSKIFRIPGLRTGFFSGTPEMVRKLMGCYQPWSVNSLAQAVIEHIFGHPEQILPFYEQSRAYVRRQRELFLNGLADEASLQLVTESETCFLLAHLEGVLDAPMFCDAVGNERILIRDCSNFDGLGPRYVRFSLKKETENRKLLACIQKVTAHA